MTASACICDGGGFDPAQSNPFIVEPTCPVHGEQNAHTEALRLRQLDGTAPYSIGSTTWPGLSKLVEELGELQAELGKLLGSGDPQHWVGDLRPRIAGEIGDVYAALIYFTGRNAAQIDGRAIAEQTTAKLALFNKWHRDAEHRREPKPAPPCIGGRS